MLRRATDATAPEARETFLAYWTGHGSRYFRLEEELLFPAYAGYGDPHDPRVLRALGDRALPDAIRGHELAPAFL